ncbi:hypothetical protein H113_07037 [Trichophyton rubrum MR1459]|uniref:Uncharacterized protein n=1 Tax=Trichophyton rubrum (strain ATCC MYA-4607 / CBS 118892) TaxID=559305 RepID=F2SGJ9_TRIRC|nr:uncharacterized protein TERG_02322 [Trichophyton rubrum CBS 118892]EZF38893.1 hypothetical protein H102_06962 [Trichophyton rubrum CBS 100081]EZF60235.1 hypothetical protein H104_06940 [Trichophyton rubrum CBS 289.86]EZF81419.1 hypothetical protein H110_06981 [Trichophyton rubrum MR1448]EZF92115.1 hypothetical protein H113_07037 [Trichophyton rubrum MR1459]EZG13630.1 hypothetical protein H107_07144 [Trichophyton rubrum CBS 202.88]KMQ47922.1 hypothetical protein HL42_1498 [Trichophyton rubr
MSALRKLFSSERPIFHYDITDGGQNSYSPLAQESDSPETRPSRFRHRSTLQYIGFEKQFEDLHEQLETRPPQRRSYLGHMSSPRRTRRHVDVLEAIFSKQSLYHAPTVVPLTTTSYNEDIAERNLASGGQEHRSCPSRYSHVISAIFQEDVADRNMVLFSPPILISPPPGEEQMARNNQKRAVARRVKMSQRESDSSLCDEAVALRTIASDQDIRRHPSHSGNRKELSSGKKLRADSDENSPLRLRKSAPNFSVHPAEDEEHNPNEASTASKKLPQARRTQDTSQAERDCEQTIERPLSKSSNDDTQVAKESTSKPESRDASSTPPHNSSNRLLSPNSARRRVKRNVRDLSINTQLAAPGKKFAKISKKSPLRPVPVSPCREPSATLDEIVNSPTALTSPINPSPRLTGFTASEMLNLFKQACASSQTNAARPTFESLQDTIIREINSHDAFSHINPQSPNPVSPVPSLTPDLSTNGKQMEKDTARPMTALSRTRSVSSREGSLRSKLSFCCDHQLRPESQGREISFPAIKELDLENSNSVALKRRHSCSQPAPGPRVRIFEPDDSSPTRGRSVAGRRQQVSIATGQLSDMYQTKDPIGHSSLHFRQQLSNGYISKAVSIFDTPQTIKPSMSLNGRDGVHMGDISPPVVSIFSDFDEKPYGPKRKRSTTMKSSKLHLFIPCRKSSRPKHIPIVISNTTTNNVLYDPPSSGTKKSPISPLSTSSGRKRMPFRIIGS